MSLKILVTGGAGYLGSILVEELLGQGHHVTVLDNFHYQQNSLAHLCHLEKLEIVRGDVREEALIAKLLGTSDVVIPLAALVGAPACDRDPTGAKTINREAVLMMLKKLSSRQMLLMPTTNSAYGSGGKDHYCDENSPLNPLSLYARDKVEVESAIMQRENSISFRLATVFGMSPRMRIDLLVNDFTYRAVTDRFIVLFESSFRRNFIHIRDVARVFLHGLERFDAMRGEVFNVGLSNANLSKKELCDLIRVQLPEFSYMEAPVGEDPDKRNYVVSNQKLEKTGFRPEFSLEAGIRELIKGYRMIRNSRYANV